MFCELFVNQMLCGLYLTACKNNIKKGHLLKHSRTFSYIHTLIYSNTFIAVYECLFICVYIFANLCVQLSMFFFHIFFRLFYKYFTPQKQNKQIFFIIFIKIRKNNLSIKVCQFKKRVVCVSILLGLNSFIYVSLYVCYYLLISKTLKLLFFIFLLFFIIFICMVLFIFSFFVLKMLNLFLNDFLLVLMFALILSRVQKIESELLSVSKCNGYNLNLAPFKLSSLLYSSCILSSISNHVIYFIFLLFYYVFYQKLLILKIIRKILSLNTFSKN